MMRYALGIIFDSTKQRVVLMRKNRPDWQKGKLNGVGGKVEQGEDTIACIVREVAEESGLHTDAKDWKKIARFRGFDWDMDIFTTVTSRVDEIQSLTDERVGWYEVEKLPMDTLSNIPWLVKLALDRLENDEIETCELFYRARTK